MIHMSMTETGTYPSLPLVPSEHAAAEQDRTLFPEQKVFSLLCPALTTLSGTLPPLEGAESGVCPQRVPGRASRLCGQAAAAERELGPWAGTRLCVGRIASSRLARRAVTA